MAFASLDPIAAAVRRRQDPRQETFRNHAEWWEAKIERNRSRDFDTEGRLAAHGWRVVVVWEHDDPEEAAEGIASLVRARVRR